MARPARRKEGETLPRDSARRDDRRGSEAQARPPRDAGQGARPGRLRVPAVRRGVSIARMAQEREGAPPEARGRHVALSVPGRGSLATGHLLHRLARRGRWRPLRGLDGLHLHPEGRLGLAAGPLLSLQPSGIEEGADERDSEGEQSPPLGRGITSVKKAQEKQGQKPENEGGPDPSLREIENPTPSAVPS